MKSEVAEGIKQMLSVTTPAEQIIVFGELVSTELGNSLDFYRLLVKSLPGKYSSLGATDEERNLIRLIYMHWVEVGAKIDPLQTFKDLLPVSDYFVFGDVIADFISEQLKIRELDEFVETLFGDSDLVPNSARGKLFRLLLEQNFFRGSKAKQPILAELQRFPHQTLKILNIEIDDLIPLLIEHGVIEDEEDVSKTLPLLLTNDEYLTYHCTGTSQWRKFIELIYSIEVVRTLAEKACVHLCRIQAIDRLIRERSTGSGRALFWLLHDCWKATQNINYISDAFSFFNLIGETELIAFAQTGARGKPSNLVPMAIAILQFLSHDHGSAIKILLKDLEPNKRESLRIVFQNFIVKSAWRLSETGPTACYPNDPIRESRERSKQEEVKQEYIATQMALFDRILDVNTRPSISQTALSEGTEKDRKGKDEYQIEIQRAPSSDDNSDKYPYEGPEYRFGKREDKHMAKIFISYSRKDEKKARQIKQYLEDNSQKVWIDIEEILVGHSIPKKIQEGLTTSDFILVLISSSSVKSGWVEKEVEFKLFHEISTGKIAVLGVLCEKPDNTWTIPALLSAKKYADITDDFDSGMEDVLNAIRGHTHSPSSPPKSTTQYINYVLGFTVAKIAWFHGNPIQLLGLKAQYRNFVSRLSIERELSEQVLNLFRPSSGLGDVLKNAQIGIEARNTLTTVIMVQFGEKAAAAFRFGFNLINLMPQLEFLETAQESGSSDTPPEQLLGPMENQFTSLYNDGTILRLPENHLSILRQAHNRSSQGQTSSVRNDLIEVGSAIERDMKTE